MLPFSLIFFLLLSSLVNANDYFTKEFDIFKLTYKLYSSKPFLNADNETIYDRIIFTLSSNHTGWLSLGFGTIWSKKDLIILYFDGDTPKIEDRFTPGMKTPVIDQKQNAEIHPELCIRTQTSTIMTFSRHLDTGDSEQDIPIILDEQQLIFFAWGETDKFTKYKNYQGEEFVFRSPNYIKRLLQQNQTVCEDGYILNNGTCMFNDIREPVSKFEIMPGIFLHWEIEPDNKTVDFLFKYNFRGYFSIGLAPTMFNSDMHIANIINNGTGIQMLDTYSNADSRPTTDKQNDLKLKGFSISSTQTIVKYSRLLKTNDTTQDQELVIGGKYQFCAAWLKTSDTMRYHGQLYTTFNITLKNISVNPCPDGQILVNSSCQINDIKEPSQMLQLASDMFLYWDFKDDSIDFMFKYYFRGWFSIGLTPTMTNTDMHVAEVYEPEMRMLDTWSTGALRPTTDTNQDLFIKGYYLGRDLTIVKYNRKLNTSDPQDQPLERNGKYSFCASWTRTDKMRSHGPNYFSFDIILTDGSDVIKNCTEGQIQVGLDCVDNDVTESGNFQEILKGIYLFWEFKDNKTTIEFMYKYNFRGWFGLGLGPTMTNCDMHIAQLNGNKASIIDTWSIGDYAPVIDKKQNLILTGYNVTNDWTIVKYKRDLNTNDTQDKAIAVGGQYSFCIAYSKDDRMKYHGPNYATFDIKLDLGVQPDPICQDGYVVINGTCEINDIEDPPFYVQIINGVYLFWEFKYDNSIDFLIKYNFRGWFGLGLGPSMTNTDMHIIQLTGNKASVLDTWSLGDYAPVIDDQQDLVLKGYIIQDNRIEVKYNRKLFTNDSMDQTLAQEEKYTFCFGYSYDDKMRYHGPYYGSFRVKLTNTNQQVNCPKGYKLVEGECKDNSIKKPTSKLKLMEGVYLYWQFNDQEETIDFMYSYNFKGWFSIGLGPTMFNTDMHVAQIANNGIELLDTWSTGDIAPEIDQEQNLKLLGYFVSDGEVVVKYNRKLNTNDNQDQPLVKGGEYKFCFAYSRDEKMRYHGPNYAAFQVTLLENFEGEAELEAGSKILQLHKLLLFWGWGLLSDISIIFGRFFRSWSYYITVHTFLFYIIDILTMVFAVLIMMENQEKLKDYEALQERVQFHFVLGLIFLSLMVLQHFSGMLLKMSIQSSSFNDRIANTRIFHFIIGYLLYILSKMLVINGKFIEGEDKTIQGIGITLGAVIMRLVCEILYKKAPQFLLFERDKSNINKELLNMFNKGMSMRKIYNEFPDLRFCLLSGRLYDTSQLVHPGGNFIIEEMNGREIDCYMYGGYFYEKYKNQKAYEHSIYAINVLEKYYIGTLDTKKINFLIRKKDTANINEWQIAKSKYLASTVKQIEFKSPRHKVKNFMTGVAWMGTRFSIYSEEINKKRLYTTVLTMNDINCEYRKHLVQYAMNKFEGNFEFDYQLIKQNNDLLTFIIKNYHEFNSQSSLSSFMHMNSQSKFIIEGPFGIGLQLGSYSGGQYIFFSGGTGILPFLDFLDFLLKQTIYNIAFRLKGEAFAKEKIDPFGIGYGTELKGVKVIAYVSFASIQEFLGKDIIMPLLQLNKEYNFNTFDLCVRLSNKPIQDQHLKQVECYFDEQFIQQQSKNWGKCERAYICGPPDMVRTVPDYLAKNGIDPLKIFIL